MLSSKHAASILTSLLVIALLSAVYVYIVLPKGDEAGALRQSVALLEQEIIQLQQDNDSLLQTQKDTMEHQFIDQKKLPLHKDMATLLLNIEEVEVMSSTKIVKIEFNNYDASVKESMLQEPAQPLSLEALATPAIHEGAVHAPASLIVKESLPSQLQMVTFIIDLHAASEQDLSTFIKGVETLERVVRMDRVDIELPGENATYEQGATLVKAQLQASAFYFEE